MSIWLQDEFGKSIFVPYGSNISDFIESLESAPVKQLPIPESQSLSIDFPLGTDAIPSVTLANKQTRRLRVFLCHSHKDKPLVRSLCAWLRAENVDPWFDEESLLPGQDWHEEIKKALRSIDAVIICFSTRWVNKAGFIHKEIKTVLEIADEQPPGNIFIIPAKFEECEIPDAVRRWHWVDLFDGKGHELLMRALKKRADEVSKSFA